MLNRRARYAIKALIYIGKSDDSGNLVSVSAIAGDTQIPQKYLEAILTDLKKSGILGSRKGVNGGFYYTTPPESVSLTHLIRVINGPIALVPCVSLNFYESCEHCEDEEACALHHVMLQVRDSSLAILSGCSIKDLIDKESTLRKILHN